MTLTGTDLVPFSAKTTLLIVLATVLSTGHVRTQPVTQAFSISSTIPDIPIQTDDGQDPINLIFAGYAPSWWVTSNLIGWSDTAYCSGPKSLESRPYNDTLERPDPIGTPCIGPRDHIRIWDMGYSSTFGIWSVASAHHEHTSYDPLPPHHVIDSWETAEADARSSFLGEQATITVSNYTLANRGNYQGIFNDGNATMIELKPPPVQYPIIFSEDGLGNQTSWSATLNGATVTSPRPAIVFTEPNGTYNFAIAAPSGFNTDPSSGTILVTGRPIIENIHFRTPWTTSTATINSNGRHVEIKFNTNATVKISTLSFSSGGTTDIRFDATELGAIGAVNVTIPRSVVSSGATSTVLIDGGRGYATTLTSDGDNYYVSFLLPYGKHSVHLQFAAPSVPYVDYVVGATLAAAFLVVLLATFKTKQRKNAPSTDSSYKPLQVP